MHLLKKVTLSVAFAGFASLSASAMAETFQLDPTHTSVVVSWNHFGFSNPTASFSDVTGTLNFDDADATKSKVSVKIPVKTVDTRVPALTKEFLAKDYFDAEGHPQATFDSTKVVKTAVNEYDVTGKLTIKGITKEVVLHAKLNKEGEHPMKKKPTVGFDATTEIKRSEFGMGQYVPYVSDEVTIHITTEASTL